MLKLVKRGKKGIYQIVGTVRGQRYRESTGLTSQPHAEALLAKRQTEILDRHTWGEERTTTFAEAVIHYLDQGGSGRFLEPLVEKFGNWRLSDITPLEVSKHAAEAHPSSGPQGINRQVYTPLIAVMRCAARAKMGPPCTLERPKIPKRKAVHFAKDDYLGKLLPHCNKRLKGSILLITFTGARASEACRVMPDDVDVSRGEVTLQITKSGKPRICVLPDIVIEALIPLLACDGPVFGYSSRFSLNQAIERACERAGVPYLSSHKLGRHAFAARLLRQGRTLKDVQEAGGWDSFKMVSDIYGHLERSAVNEAVRSADADLSKALDGGKVVPFKRASSGD